MPGGRAIILVPQNPKLYNTLDEVLEHRERYTAAGLRASLERAGFRVERLLDFNRTSVAGVVRQRRVVQASNVLAGPAEGAGADDAGWCGASTA